MKTKPMVFEVKVDDLEATQKIKNIIKALEKCSETIERNSNIQINVSVVQVKKKWYQFWK
jgi:hypothetical protein